MNRRGLGNGGNITRMAFGGGQSGRYTKGGGDGCSGGGEETAQRNAHAQVHALHETRKLCRGVCCRGSPGEALIPGTRARASGARAEQHSGSHGFSEGDAVPGLGLWAGKGMRGLQDNSAHSWACHHARSGSYHNGCPCQRGSQGPWRLRERIRDLGALRSRKDGQPVERALHQCKDRNQREKPEAEGKASVLLSF